MSWSSLVFDGLDGESDAALHFVDLDDPGGDFVADLDDVLDLGDVILAELADMDQAVDVALKFHERAEAGDLRDRALDQIAHFETTVDVVRTDLPQVV